MRRILCSLAVLIAAALPAWVAAGAASDADREALRPSAAVEAAEAAAYIEDGRAIAQGQCARCHAIAAAGESPYAGAPPLRFVLARYRADALTQDLNEGMRVGHPDMPEFHLPIQGVDALIAYLQSIQQAAPRAQD